MASTNSGNWGTGSGSSLSGGQPSAGLPTQLTSIEIKTHNVSQSDVSGMSASQIMDILHGLDAQGVADAGAAHTKLGNTLKHIAGRLATNANTLAQNWQGTAAQAAMNKFQEMHDNTTLLAQQALQTGAVLSWLGNEVLPKYKNLPDPHVTSATAADMQTGASIGEKIDGVTGAIVGDAIGGIASAIGIGSGTSQAQANATAQKYLTSLNEHLVQANAALPNPIGQPPTQIGGGGPTSVTPRAGTAVSARGASGTTVPGSGSGAGGGAPVGAPVIGTPPSATGLHSTPAPGVTGHNGPTGGGIQTGSLQSVTPPPSGGTTLPPSSPPPGGGPSGPGGFTGLPGGPFPGGNSRLTNGNIPPSEGGGPSGVGEDIASEALTGENLPGPGMGDAANVPGIAAPDALGASSATAADSMAPDTLSAQAAQSAGSSAMDAEGVAGQGMTSFPMGGGASGQQDKERQRQAWMNEDEDIWGLPKDNIPPVIEGG
jgi:hypothetical protein